MDNIPTSPSQVPKEEYLEAIQAEANDYQKKFRATLSPIELAKFEAVDKAVETLVKAGVLFYLFPYLPTNIENKWSVWQWNSLITSAKYDKKGFMTPESEKQNSIFHGAFCSYIFNLFGKSNKDKSFEETMNTFIEWFHVGLKVWSDYWYDKPEEKP